MSDGKKPPPKGRLKRLGRMASLTAKVTGELLTGGRGEGRSGEARAAGHIVETLGELKGAAMKLGQMLSMDPAVLSEEGRKLLSRLQSQAPSVPWEEMEDVLIDELGGLPEEFFAEFDRTPLASASLGQVYRARTRDGRSVAVKVQYPGIGQAILSDVENLGMVVRAVGLAGRGLDLSAYYGEIRTELARELDYRQEAENTRLFRTVFSRWPDIFAPAVVPELSTGRILTLELIDGVPLGAFAVSDADNDARMRVSRQLSLAIVGPLLTDGVMHVDPHPGNFLVTPDGRLAVLDFGAVKHFSPAFRRLMGESLEAMLQDQPLTDPLEMIRRGGFVFDGEDPGPICLALEEARQIVRRPVATDFYGYGSSSVAEDLRAMKGKWLKHFLKLRPPSEAVMFFRALAGCFFNLRALKGKGNFRALVQEQARLAEIGERAGAGRVGGAGG